MKKKTKKILSMIWVWTSVLFFRVQYVLADSEVNYDGTMDYTFDATHRSGQSVLRTSLAPFVEVLGILCKSIGGIIILWSIFELGQAMQNHDGSTIPAALKRGAAGIILILAPTIINWIL